MNALPCTSQALAHASPHLCHIGCDSDRRLHRLIHQHQRWPVRMPSIMATSKALVMASSAPYCPCSDSGRRRQVPGIHFIWIGTVRIMMINIANPPVCFVLGIRIAELIHWSFPRGFGERVRQNTEFISGSTGHWAESCLLCKIILLIAACLINPDCLPQVFCQIILSCFTSPRLWLWDAISRFSFTGMTGREDFCLSVFFIM